MVVNESEWIAPRVALDLVNGPISIPALNQPYRTEQRILEWIFDDRLTLKVRTVISYFQDLERVPEILKSQSELDYAIGASMLARISNGNEKLFREEMVDVDLNLDDWIGTELFSACSNWWNTGDLVVGSIKPGIVRVSLYGIQFCRSEILRCSGISHTIDPVSQAAPDMRSVANVRGGRPRAGEGTWRDAVIIATYEKFETGSWQPSSENEIIREMLDWINAQPQYLETPANATLRPIAKLLKVSFDRVKS